MTVLETVGWHWGAPDMRRRRFSQQVVGGSRGVIWDGRKGKVTVGWRKVLEHVKRTYLIVLSRCRPQAGSTRGGGDGGRGTGRRQRDSTYLSLDGPLKLDLGGPEDGKPEKHSRLGLWDRMVTDNLGQEDMLLGDSRRRGG